MNETFKSKTSFEDRLKEATRIRNKYPNRVPIIVERYNGSNNNIPDIDKHKFLVPNDINLGQFSYIIRKRIKLSQEQAMFIFVKNKILPVSILIGAIDKDYQDEDKFIYFTYCSENVFGK